MKAILDKISYEFVQEGNCNESTDDTEILTVDVESVYGDLREGGGFYTIKTKTGWSIDSIEELYDLLKDVKNGVPNKTLEDVIETVNDSK